MARNRKATIQFFRLLDGDGQLFDSDQNFDTNVLDVIQALPADRRARPNVGGLQMTADVSDADEDDGRRVLTAYRTRGDMLPGQDIHGEVRDLTLDPEARGLSWGTHVMFFPGNVMGLMFNSNGPSFSKVTSYISDVAGFGCSAVVLIDPETWRKLDNLEGVSEAVLRTQAQNLTGLQTVDPTTAEALRQTAAAFEFGDIELVFRWRGDDRYEHGNRAKRMLQRLLSSGGSTYMDKLQVRGIEDGETQEAPLNLLARRVTVRQEIEYEAPGGLGRLPPRVARQTILEAYDEVTEEIARALTPK